MTSMAVITPSFRPDLAGFRRLHASVRRYTDAGVKHHVIVPGRDARLFRDIGSDRLEVWTYQDVLPAGVTATDRLAVATRRVPGLPASFNCAAINGRRPWKPVRGWVLQQIVKMCMVDHVTAEVLVNIDSDVVLVRHLAPEKLVRDGTVRLYTLKNSIGPEMRHYRWAETAHELLGLPWTLEDSYPDHIAGLVSWDPRLLRACLDRVEEVSGGPWAQAIAERLRFSEDILYGTYVRAFGSEPDLRFQRDTTLCHSYWETEAMGADQVERFVAGFKDEDCAVHIQSNTDTEDRVFSAVVERLSGASPR
ncbi:DUF6492 family protein [Citricoccus sp.]|uniref:DUF6492 family protein n=1 Tax=Citricoccus sp. TaxID=1978372 RepID=UPI0028BDF68D|nr:DUF6492 family protein [Citricoccus sp.]